MLTRVHLCGAPGSGKTVLANEIARAQESRGVCPVAIIDNYVMNVEQRTDMGTGAAAGYLAEVAIAIERYGQERKAVVDSYRTIICCGTLADTACHAALNAEIVGSQLAWEASRIIMPLFGAMRAHFGKPLVYLLPLESKDAPSYEQSLDLQLPIALEALQISYRTLEGPRDQWTASILEDIIADEQRDKE